MPNRFTPRAVGGPICILIPLSGWKALHTRGIVPAEVTPTFYNAEAAARRAAAHEALFFDGKGRDLRVVGSAHWGAH